MTRRVGETRDARPVPPQQRLVIERVPMRLPDRVGFGFEDRYRKRLAPVGRPLDIYGDVIVSVARLVREDRRG